MVLGAVIKKTRLTEEFEYEDFRALYGHEALVLFVIDDCELIARTSESTNMPTAGQTLISLVEPLDETQREAAASEAEETVAEEQEDRLENAIESVVKENPGRPRTKKVDSATPREVSSRSAGDAKV